MNLEPGTRILSDNIKVGAEYKKALSDLFDMKNIKANDTVAKVMEKYLEKSGVTAIQKRQEEVLKGLKENMSVKDEATRRTNEQFYADKIIKTQAELNEKQKEQALVFNVLFQMQEARKAKNEQGDPSAKNIRKRPPLEQEFVPYEGPPPVEEETAQPVEVVPVVALVLHVGPAVLPTAEPDAAAVPVDAAVDDVADLTGVDFFHQVLVV